MYNFDNITMEDIEFGEIEESPYTEKISTVMVVVFAVMLMERVIYKFSHTVSNKLVVLVVSLTFAVVQELAPTKYVPNLDVYFLKGMESITMLMPITILRITCNLDLPLFRKCLFQILILGFFGMGLFLALVGYASYLFGNTSDSDLWMYMFLFGLVFAAIDDVEISKCYMEYEAIRDALVILDGEYILTTAICITGIHISQGILIGFVSEWYQVLTISIRYIGIGIAIGFAFGWFIASILSYMLDNLLDMTTSLVIFVYFVFYLCEYVIECSGIIATFVLCACTIKARHRASSQADAFLKLFFDLVYSLIMYGQFAIAITTAFRQMFGFIDTKLVVRYMATYFSCFFTRMFVLTILYPVLKLTGRHLQLNSMMVIFWLSKRGVVPLIILQAFHRAGFTKGSINTISGHIVFTITMGLIFQSIFTKRFLNSFGLTEKAVDKKFNFTKCIDVVHGQQIRLIDSFKSYKLFSDIKWSRVNKANILFNPYLSVVNMEDKGNRLMPTFCEECKSEVYIKPAKKDLFQAVREIKFRILRAHKVSIRRLCRKNIIDVETNTYILSKLEEVMTTNEFFCNREYLLNLFRKRTFLVTLKDFLVDIKRKEILLMPPRKKLRRICYKIVTIKGYDVIMYFVCLSYVLEYYLRLAITDRWYAVQSEVVYTSVFFLDFFIKIMAHSTIYIREGFKLYLRDLWNVFDLIVLVSHFLATVLSFLYRYAAAREDSMKVYICYHSIKQITLLRLLRTLIILYHLRYSLVKICNKRISTRLAFSYNVANALLISYIDIRHMLAVMRISPEIYDSLMQVSEIEQVIYHEDFSSINHLMASIISAHHTRMVCNEILFFLKGAARHFRRCGQIDSEIFENLSLEYRNMETTASKFTVLGSFKTRRDVFKNVPWLQETTTLEVVMKIAKAVKWKENKIVVGPGNSLQGVIILTEGMLLSYYQFTPESIEQLSKYGILPVADYHDYQDLVNKAPKCLTPGSSVGLLGILTGRKYEATVVAKVNSKGYFIPEKFFLDYAFNYTDPTHGFYSTLWKVVSFDIAHWLLWESKNYRSKTRDELFPYMIRSFVPYLCDRKTFIVTDSVKDVILIEGLVEDMSSKNVYTGPAYIPRGIKYMQLIRNKEKVEPVLWIIPIRNAAITKILEYDDFEAFKITNRLPSINSLTNTNP